MDTRTLGQTDLEISPIGLGCWQFSQGKNLTGRMWSVLDQGTMDAVVAAALDGGVTWFDTAQAYGNGASERALSAALQRRGVEPGAVVVATKWLPIAKPARDIPRTIGTRIGCLQPYPIDLFQVHSPGSLSSIPAQMREMAKLVHAGKVRSIGVSNFSAKQMAQAAAALRDEGLTLASNQVRINLLDRRIESNGVLAAAQGLGVTLIGYSPLAQGALTGRYHDDPGARSHPALGTPFAPQPLEPLPHPQGPATHGAADRRTTCGRRGARRHGGAGRPGLARDPLRRHRCRHPRRFAARAGSGGRCGHGRGSHAGRDGKNRRRLGSHCDALGAPLSPL